MNWTLNLESSDLLSDHYYGPPLAGSCACTNLVRLECARGLSCYLFMIMLLRGLETGQAFPGGLVVRIWRSHRHGPGSIPGQGK